MQKYYFCPKAQACKNARRENYLIFVQLRELAEEAVKYEMIF